MTAALVDDLTGVEAELEKPCDARKCPHAATWLAWARHNWAHVSTNAYLCDACHDDAELDWIEIVDDQAICVCGYRYVGQLSDYFRAIRL